MPGEDAFRFRHLLIRDAAYEAMPKELRAELHERFADWLDQIADLAEQDEIVGYHLEQAYRYRVELAPVDAAAEALALRAGERLGAPPAVRRGVRCVRGDRAQRACARPSPGDARATTPACSRISDTRCSSVATSTRLEAAYDDGPDCGEACAGDRAAGALIEARKATLQTMRGGLMDDAVTSLRRAAPRNWRNSETKRLWPKSLYLLGQHISWTDGDPTDDLERAAGIANTLGNLRLEAAVIGWLCVDAFWYEGSVDGRV